MTAFVWLALLLGPDQPPQDTAKIAGLIRRLESKDWVDQARAATELARIGKAVLTPLGATALSTSPAPKYWAARIKDVVSGGAPAPAPAAAAAAPKARPKQAESHDPTFDPGVNNIASVMFICNGPGHAPMEVILSRCLTCAKTRRFAYDHRAKCFRCSLCKMKFTAIYCKTCRKPPAPRARIRMKRH